MTEQIAQADAADKMRPKPSHIAPENTVAVGDEGDQVERTYEYLRRFGYFPNERLARQYPMWRSAVAFDLENPRTYGEKLKTAVGLFQQANGLPVTGDVDEDTLDLMNQPRCGFPDVVVEGVGEFVAQGNRWNVNPVSYSYTNTTPDLPVADVRSAVRGAFDRWSAVSSLNFVENPNGGDIRVGFFSGDHGDGSSFDGPSGVLAHCFFPPPNGGDIAGDCHFDEAETWSVNTPPSGIDLPTVALHEMGHGLGLAHSSVTSAVMYPYYGGPRRELADDDIAGIRSIYGARFRWASLAGAVFDPVVVPDADGRLEAFVRGTDGALWHMWQTAPNNGWSGWASLGGIIDQPSVASNADGRLEVFVRGADNALWHIWQTRPNNGWSGWSTLSGQLIGGPVAARNADGRLEVFVKGTDNALWHTWQSRPNNGWT